MDVLVTHIYREGNQAADTLARHGVLQGDAWRQSHPNIINSVITNDFVSRVNYRFVI